MKHSTSILLVLLLLLSTSCGPKISLKKLENHQEEWQALGLSDYKYTMDYSCFCNINSVSPMVVVVRGDTVSQVLNPETGEDMIDPWDSTLAIESYVGQIYTIDEFYNRLIEIRKNPPYSMSMKFHSDFPYPSEVWVDQIKRAVDDELVYFPSDLEAL